jgi:hypothetical protein
MPRLGGLMLILEKAHVNLPRSHTPFRLLLTPAHSNVHTQLVSLPPPPKASLPPPRPLPRPFLRWTGAVVRDERLCVY